MKKRFFSLLLAVAMVISIAPIALAEDTNANGNFVEMTVDGTTVAYSDPTEFFAAFTQAATAEVKLLDDFAIPTGYHVEVAEGQTVTFDFNGFTLSKSDSGAAIENKGNLLLKGEGGISAVSHCVKNSGNIQIDGGTYTTTQINASTALLNLDAPAEMTINNADVRASFYAVANSSGILTVNGGNFTSTSCNHEGNFAYAVSNQGGELYFNDGTVTGVQGALAIAAGYAEVRDGTFKTVACTNEAPNCQNGGTAHYALYCAGERGTVRAEISGGTFESVSKVAAYIGNDNIGDGGQRLPAAVCITNGVFISGAADKAVFQAPTTGNLEILGGTYNGDVSDYLPSGMTQDGSGNVIVNTEIAVATVNGVGYATVQEAINAAKSGGTVVLEKSTTESVTIAEGQSITLDLNGCTLTGSDSHSIHNKGSITVIDSKGSGQVVNNVSGSAALFNTLGATATLSGGTFTGNTWYVIKNLGTLTIEDGTTVEQQDAGSSNIANGWYNASNSGASDQGVAHTDDVTANLTITGGVFSGGMNTVKNDDYSVLDIQGGSFSNTAGPTVLNWNVATISGGTFEVNDDSYAVLANGFLPGGGDQGQMTITGGTFTASGDGSGNLFGYGVGSNEGGSVTLDGGTFIGYIATSDDYPYSPVVKGGDYSQPVDSEYLDATLTTELQKSSGAAPYSYYTDIDAALEHAQSGDKITDLSGPAETPDEPITVYTVTYVNGTTTWSEKVLGNSQIQLASLSNQGNNYFRGWMDANNGFYSGGDVVTVTGDMTFTAVWDYLPPVITNPSYSVSVPVTANGTVTVSPAAAQQGQTVTVTAVPNEGYELSALTITDRFGNTVMTQANPNGTYSFVMPGSQVTVSAVFVEKAPDIWVNPFVDVAANDWFYPYVEYVCRNGLMEGTSAVTFDPSGTVTRGTVATILWRLAGSPVVNYQMTFPDVAEGEWYSEAVRWAASEGVITGYDNGNFGPNDPITREQLAVMLYRYAQKQGEGFTGAWAFPLDYADAEQVSAYAYEAMCWMTMNGVINGRDGLLAPQGTAARAELAAMLTRFAGQQG